MGSPHIKVLAKAARLLEVLAEFPDSSPPSLAQRLGEPRPTVYRLVQDLATLGYLEEGPRPGTYRLGLELFRLGSLVGLRFDVRERAAPLMNNIHAELEETVYLVVRRHHEAVCIDRIEGVHIRSMALQLGGALPLHLGAGPRVLLAFEPREYWDDYFTQVKLEPRTPRTPTTQAPASWRFSRRQGTSAMPSATRTLPWASLPWALRSSTITVTSTPPYPWAVCGRRSWATEGASGRCSWSPTVLRKYRAEWVTSRPRRSRRLSGTAMRAMSLTGR